MLVDLPRTLREPLQRLSQGYAPQELGRAATDLSARYREEHARGVPIAQSVADVAAYAAYRFPATYAAIVAALEALKEQRDALRPRSMLDLGAGLGAGLWAAERVWPDIERLTAVDAQQDMITSGWDLCRTSTHSALRSAKWIHDDVRRAKLSQRHDVVLLAYVLAEMDEADIEGLLDRAWRATAEALVIVEPGTPAGYQRVRSARAYLRSRGGFSIAPCPHDPPCEVPEDDWCHFSVRLPRSKMHRAAKGAELGYEDEKFAYVVMAREPVTQTYSRILRHPQIRKGHIYLQLCTPEGVKTIVVSKSDGDLYSRARKAAWGDVFPFPES